MKPKIWLSAPHMGGNEQHYVNEAFESNWVAPLGPNVDALEQSIAQYLGENTSVAALSSGTAAIHLALVMLGVQPGDEVICQSMTFSASANPIAYLGATPIFIDSEPETWNMSPVHLEAAIQDRIKNGKKPKAIIPVHLYGMPAHMSAIMEIAERYDVPVLEDAAEALGSTINGVKCGTFGSMSVLSFNGNKIITTSGGGALVARDAKYTDKARFLSTQARDAAPHYQHSQIGYNYRMSNICAGIGRGQMEVLPERVAQRRTIFEKYRQRYASHPGVSFLPEPTGYISNRWLTTILIDPQLAGANRETLRLALEADNIESRPLWKPMHLQPVFADCPFYGDDCAENLFENGLCLPSTSSLTENEIERIFSVMDTIFQHELTIVGGR